ncbi:MAG: helix-turn-helix domain-containing protein [Acidobacteriota bacterium]|nr:helix-turn-helix domain-containing protein [Acidobacteriota bacterium]
MVGQSFPWNARPTWLCWSGGKDSAWALGELRADPSFEVRGLISLVNEKNGRVILHGVRHTLLQRQAEAVGLPLRFVPLDWTSSRGERNAALSRGFGEVRADGAACVAFGDLFSVEGRDRRLLVTADTGLEVVFPLWNRDTRAHSAEMLEAGLSAWVCSVDTGFLPASLTGHRFDADFVAGLPEGVDPCGGNDEFHTFVEWAPGWESRVEVEPTRSIEVYDFAFAEIEAADGSAPRRIDPFSRFARLDRVRRHVDRHIAEDLNVGALARVAAMSRTGFSRFFREHVGMTFASWLAHRRIERACQLLRENNDAVSRIAEAVGFHSERTFRRSFHEQMDCSPSEYRRKALEE